MNYITAYVVDVLSKPELVTAPQLGISYWGVKVKSQDMGGYQLEELSFDTKEEAEEVEIGYKFQH